jgi:hypothetical protein
VARPIQLDFVAREDKAAIGKRRKIERTNSVRARRPIAVHEPPLFAERPPFEEHFMSGALLTPDNDGVRIKIGTDAFASQTQPSMISRTPVTTHIHNFSSRHPGHSSEEVIELSSDVEQSSEHASDQPDWYDIGVAPGFPDGMQTNYQQKGPAISKHAARPRHDTHSAMSIAEMSKSDDLLSLPSPLAGPISATPHDWSPKLITPEAQRYAHESPVASLNQHVATAPSLAKPSPVVDSVEIDEENWRQFLDLTPKPYDEASVAVLRSSSRHLTPSTRVSSPPPPMFERLDRQASRIDPELLAKNDDHKPANKGTSPTKSIHSGSDSGIQSTSASLQQLQKLINLIPPHKDPHEDEMLEDEEMWRRFVIGSHGSDGSSTTHRTPRIVRDLSDTEMEPTFNTDDDSDKATIATSRAAPMIYRDAPSKIFHDYENTLPAKKSLSLVAEASTAHFGPSEGESLLSSAAMPILSERNQEVSVDPRRRFKRPLAATAVTTVKRYNTRSRGPNA